MAQWLTNPTRNHEVVGLIPGFTQGIKNLALLWLWRRLLWLWRRLLWLWRRLEAKAPIPPLAWEPPHAAGSALDMAKKTKKRQKKKGKFQVNNLSFHLKKLEKEE